MSIFLTKYSTWMVRWRDADHIQRGRTFSTREAAEAFETQIRSERVAAKLEDAHRGQRHEDAKVVAAINPHGYHVYILWGDYPARPLYIGRSKQVLARIAWHLSRPEKRALIRQVTVLRCETAREMRSEERRVGKECRL